MCVYVGADIAKAPRPTLLVLLYMLKVYIAIVSDSVGWGH